MSARITDAIEYSSFASAINLYAVKDRDIERLEILTASVGATITCTTKQSGETTRTYHVTQGVPLDYAIRSIASVSGVTLVCACWGDF
jgi:hypothetical protein